MPLVPMPPLMAIEAALLHTGCSVTIERYNSMGVAMRFTAPDGVRYRVVAERQQPLFDDTVIDFTKAGAHG